MKPKIRTRWNIPPRQAIALQKRYRTRVILDDRWDRIETIAGADIAFDPRTQTAFAGVIVYRLPDLREIERAMATGRLRFPYVPGLLSFRESPLLLEAMKELKTEPDAVMTDGHGIAHPRRFGIACHLGVLLDKPSIGCAKSLLVGEHRQLSRKTGSRAPLMHKDEIVGMVLRTRDGVPPIYISQGHRVSLETAVSIAQTCLDGFRIPKPTREADRYVRKMRQAYQTTRKGLAGS